MDLLAAGDRVFVGENAVRRMEERGYPALVEVLVSPRGVDQQQAPTYLVLQHRIDVQVVGLAQLGRQVGLGARLAVQCGIESRFLSEQMHRVRHQALLQLLRPAVIPPGVGLAARTKVELRRLVPWHHTLPFPAQSFTPQNRDRPLGDRDRQRPAGGCWTFPVAPARSPAGRRTHGPVAAARRPVHRLPTEPCSYRGGCGGAVTVTPNSAATYAANSSLVGRQPS